MQWFWKDYDAQNVSIYKDTSHYVLDQNDRHSIIEHTFAKHQRIEIHIDVQVTEYRQHRH